MWILRIAGLRLELNSAEAALKELEEIYRDFASRGREYESRPENPHLCFAGCSACCKNGAFFAVSLVEALRLAVAIEVLREPLRSVVLRDAELLLGLQKEHFHTSGESTDLPGRRDELEFSARVSRVARTGPACPLLEGDLCSVYEGRPFLCRAYGYPVDAYAVEGETEIAFRSLCHLYAGKELRNYVEARDLHGRLGELSRRLAGDRDVGRFTSAEAILARLEARD